MGNNKQDKKIAGSLSIKKANISKSSLKNKKLTRNGIDLGVKEDILTLKKKILSSKTNLNELITLIKYAESDNLETIYFCIKAVQPIILSFIHKREIQLYKPLNQFDETDATQTQIREWLNGVYKKWVKKLLNLLQIKDGGIQVACIDALFNLLKYDSLQGVEQRKCYVFNASFMEQIVKSLIEISASDLLVNFLLENFLNKYNDIRYYFLKAFAIAVRDFAQDTNNQNVDSVVNFGFTILNSLRNFPSVNEDIKNFFCVNPNTLISQDETKQNEEGLSGTLESDNIANGGKQHFLTLVTTHRREFQESWLAFFQLPLNSNYLKKILLSIHQKLLPNFLEPLTMLDFLTKSYDFGGSISLLALNGLFTLIHKYNMDYPDFYKKLYKQLTPDLLHVKYRSRFFRLCEIFLGSNYLPVNLIAAFIKRMARLALHGPPGGIAIIIPYIYNLMKMHPTSMVLIHRTEAIVSGENDPYDFNEEDPLKSKAIESSLWEIESLSNHYYPTVASLAKMFNEPFTKPSYRMEDFLDHNFNSMIEQEVLKPFKKIPALNEPNVLKEQFFTNERVHLSLNKEWLF